MYCNLCGKLIKGRFKQFHHPAWLERRRLRVCHECLQKKPVCQSCKMPMADKSNGFCVTCTKIDNRCQICGRKIRKMSRVVIQLGSYCDDCIRARTKCHKCGAPLEEEAWIRRYIRVVCKKCNEMGIFTFDEAKSLFIECKEVILETLGLQLNIPTPIILVNRDQLEELSRKQETVSPDFDIRKTMGIYARRGIKRGIYVQKGLPRRLFIQVASHEYAHAWQGENCPLLKDTCFREGFAEWVAYIVLSIFNDKELMMQMLNGDNKYSQGLQKILELESKVGRQGVLEACRKHR